MFKLLNYSLSTIFIIVSITFLKEDKLQKKILRVGDFDIECYVSLKEKKTYDIEKVYYWYKSGEIHNSVSSAGGYVLHSKYFKYYLSNQLAEQGEFDYGLKNGVWKIWNENGSLKMLIEWKSGLKNGTYVTYDSIGNPLEKGSYKKGEKNDVWVNFTTKDTILYKKGAVLTPETNDEKEGFFKRLFKKKETTKSKEKTNKTKNSNNNKKKDSAKKDGFFKRLFNKKDKKAKAKKTN